LGQQIHAETPGLLGGKSMKRAEAAEAAFRPPPPLPYIEEEEEKEVSI